MSTDITAGMDPELLAVFSELPVIDALDPVALREHAAAGTLPPRAGVERSSRELPGTPWSAERVPVRVYEPGGRNGLLPGIVFAHGGGFTAGSAAMFDHVCDRFVANVGAVVVSVDYRLAPEHPFPAAVEDCYAALLSSSGSAAELGVDPERIAIAGISAGGGIAAGVALLARDRGEVRPAFQLLHAPCLDDRHITASSHETTDGRTWNRRRSLLHWQAYLGSERHDEPPPHAAPARARDLAGLPPAFLAVGELELLRDETMDYAARLAAAGVPTELHVYPGAFHGFTLRASETRISVEAMAHEDAALRRALHPVSVRV